MSPYESIKSSIRLLLTSSSNGLTLEQLNADYQQYNQSKSIPYANFGYQSLVDYFLFFIFTFLVSLFADRIFK